jgi:hypothetical protein
MSTPKAEASITNKTTIELECETKRVPLDPRVPNKTIMISQDLTIEEKTELLLFLHKNDDVFAWKTSDLMGVSRNIFKHNPHINPSVKPRKQKLHKMSIEKIEAAKADVQRLLGTCFIREVQYLTWLANVVMVKKKNGKWRMCTNFIDLNK